MSISPASGLHLTGIRVDAVQWIFFFPPKDTAVETVIDGFRRTFGARFKGRRKKKKKRSLNRVYRMECVETKLGRGQEICRLHLFIFFYFFFKR